MEVSKHKQILSKVADKLPQMNISQDTANMVLDAICAELGIHEPHVVVRTESERTTSLKRQQTMIKKNFVVISPSNTIEDKDNVLR